MLSVQDKSILELVGKPNPFTFNIINEKFGVGKQRTIMIGDRPNTDIAFGNACGIDTCLVMTGVV